MLHIVQTVLRIHGSLTTQFSKKHGFILVLSSFHLIHPLTRFSAFCFSKVSNKQMQDLKFKSQRTMNEDSFCRRGNYISTLNALYDFQAFSLA